MSNAGGEVSGALGDSGLVVVPWADEAAFVAAHHDLHPVTDAQLGGTDGNRYRLVGGGYDYVVYPGRAVTGNVVREDEQLHFDVIADHYVVGVVGFRLRTRSDQVPHVHDASTCQLPNTS